MYGKTLRTFDRMIEVGNLEKPYTLIPYSWIIGIEEMDKNWLSDKERFYIDLFLFSIYTGGSTMAEMACFNRNEIVEGMIRSKRIATSKMATISITKKIEAIIEKYRDRCFKNYLLPVFTYKHRTPYQQAGRIKRISELTNRTIKKVCEHLGIETEITLSAARKIFIAHMIGYRIPYGAIALWVGCSPYTVIRHHEKINQALKE